MRYVSWLLLAFWEPSCAVSCPTPAQSTKMWSRRKRRSVCRGGKSRWWTYRVRMAGKFNPELCIDNALWINRIRKSYFGLWGNSSSRRSQGRRRTPSTESPSPATPSNFPSLTPSPTPHSYRPFLSCRNPLSTTAPRPTPSRAAIFSNLLLLKIFTAITSIQQVNSQWKIRPWS